MILSTLALVALTTAPAEASVTDSRAIVRTDNVLRYDIRVQTSERAQVAVQFWAVGAPAASAWTTEYTAVGTRHQVPIWGLKPGTSYQYRVLVTPVTGEPYVYASLRRITTAALPADLPPITATTVTSAPDFSFLVFDTTTSDDHQGVLVITDNTGTVRWYQYAPNATDVFSAVYYDESSAAIWAIVNYDHVVRYQLEGTMTHNWAYGTELGGRPHHEVTMHDGLVYVLSARSMTEGGVEYIEDGIEAYDTDGTLVYDWWAAEDGGLTVTDNAPFYWYPAGAGPWGTDFRTAKDWLHANALQVRDTATGTKFIVSLRHTFQVAKVDATTGGIDWLLGMNNTGSTDAAGDFTMSGAGVSTDWWEVQHHAHYDDADGKMYLYDNGDGRMTRMLELQVNELAKTVRIDREVDVSDFTTFRFSGNCHSEGSVFRTAHDHLIATCGTEEIIADYDAADQLAWYLEVDSRGHVYRGTPMANLGF